MIATHVASAVIYCMMFQLYADPDGIALFIRYRFSLEHVNIAMMHSSYAMQTGKVVLHHTSNSDNNDGMNGMVGEDWIGMSILESTAILDIGAMDSGVIFDHNNDNVSMISIDTRGYMNSSNQNGVKHSNGITTVNRFDATRKNNRNCFRPKQSLPKWRGGHHPGR